MIDPTTARAEQIRESTGMAWEHACRQAERERDAALAAGRVREAVCGISAARSLAVRVLERWDELPDVDASSGELERAVELLGRVERDLTREIGS